MKIYIKKFLDELDGAGNDLGGDVIINVADDSTAAESVEDEINPPVSDNRELIDTIANLSASINDTRLELIRVQNEALTTLSEIIRLEFAGVKSYIEKLIEEKSAESGDAVSNKPAKRWL